MARRFAEILDRCYLALFLALMMVACDPAQPGADGLPRRATSGATATAIAEATADTAVRRVPRLTLRASAMQRVSGAMRARRALQPLDSLLSVRVLDQRGAELAGVPVRWLLAASGEGAMLRAIDARTDSLGLARAAFTPGATADAQTVAALVDDVGRIDFNVRVAPASIRVLLEPPAIWSGEDVVVRAQLRDSAGRELPGGAISWASADTAVFQLRAEDASRARVTGRLAGDANLIAWVGDTATRASAILTVKPAITGRFVTLDGAAPPPMRMAIRAGTLRDSISVANSQFGERVDLPAGPDVEIFAQPDADSTMFHRVHLSITNRRDLQNLAIALVPMSWRIDAGTYQGRVLAIDAERALQRSGGGSPFWRLVPVSRNGPRTLLGWRESDLPLRIVFDRKHSTDAIGMEDSVSFWAAARQMEQDLGARFFAPADAPAEGDSSVNRVVFVEIDAQGPSGHTFVSWSGSGDATHALLRFRHAATLRDSHVVTHELLHLLGFGHSLAWPTVAAPIGGSEPALSPHDVAYVQLALQLRRLRQTSGARPGLPIARQ